MKIIEKKCPNCHANLEFDVGEQNVECPSCRRKYAIEYDRDHIDPEMELKMKDVQLKLLTDVHEGFERGRKLSSVIIVVFVVMFVAITAFFVFIGVKIFSSGWSMPMGVESSRDEWAAEDERSAQEQQEIMDEFEKRFKES